MAQVKLKTLKVFDSSDSLTNFLVLVGEGNPGLGGQRAASEVPCDHLR